jgi:hypothetical protein
MKLIDESDVLLAPYFLGLVEEHTSIAILFEEETISLHVGVSGEVGRAEMEFKQLILGDFKPTVAGIFVECEVMDVVEVHGEEVGGCFIKSQEDSPDVKIPKCSCIS